MGYISELRRFVGHMPLIHAAASVIVERGDGRILMHRRTDNGLWNYSGGAVELYEDTRDAAKRELFEETGLRALSLELFGVFSGERLHYTYPNGDEVSTIDIVYICREWEGTPVCQPEEVSEIGWFSIDELPPLSPPIVYPMEEYIKSKKR
ncbi:MAG: NUDIX domain-containing protein [Oscillospiraceae bacterium]|nr:NUDIX domain-containing protein [Oscillospiraceae bacterium]